LQARMKRHGRRTAVVSLLSSNIQPYKTRLLLVAGALFVVCSSPAVQAQTANETSQLLNRINQLENQVQTMSRVVYRGERRNIVPEKAPLPGDAASPAAAAGFEVRISQIEDQQRMLTGQIEKISFNLQQLQNQVERMQADIEQRFQQHRQDLPPGNGSPLPPRSFMSGPSPASARQSTTRRKPDSRNS